MKLSIQVTESEAHVDVYLEGILDIETWRPLHDRLKKIVRTGPRQINVNTHDVAFMDSSGVRVLLRAIEDARARRRSLAVTRPSRSVQLAFAALDLGHILP